MPSPQNFTTSADQQQAAQRIASPSSRTADFDNATTSPTLQSSSRAFERMPSPKRAPFLPRTSRSVSSEPLLDGGATSPAYSERGRAGGSRSYEVDEEEGGVGSGLLRDGGETKRMRARSPDLLKTEVHKKKYMLAGIFLILSLISFVVQTETAVIIQTDLGWKKPFAMLYLTHGSWAVLWPLQLLLLRIRKRHISFRSFFKSHLHSLKTTAQMAISGRTHLHTRDTLIDPAPVFLFRTIFITCALTIAGSSWYIAVNMTTPSDLTAIYNCSAFFAYAFSVPLLKEQIRKVKVICVGVSIVGVLIVAYGDGGDSGEGLDGKSRLLGNLIIGVGSVLYGFYEVLYKKLGCPPEGTSPGRTMAFSNAIASGIGAATLLCLWPFLFIFHFLGFEPFELPSAAAGKLLLISVLANVVFSGSFLILISLTSPVLSSVAALLTIFLVAITDWWLFGTPVSAAGVLGGLLIVVAFGGLAWDSWKEVEESNEEASDSGSDA